MGRAKGPPPFSRIVEARVVIMDQANAQTIVLEALRQAGLPRVEKGELGPCKDCCLEVQAVDRLARLAAASGRPVHHFVMASLERPLIEKALSRTGGNQLAAARLLGMHRNSLRARMRALGIKPVKPNGFDDNAG